jgi:hypothetical protein
MNIRLPGIQLQRAAKLHNGAIRFREFLIIACQVQISCGIAGTPLDFGPEIFIGDLRLTNVTQIFSISLAVIEPDVTGQLAVTVQGFAKPVLNKQRAERPLESGRNFR